MLQYIFSTDYMFLPPWPTGRQEVDSLHQFPGELAFSVRLHCFFTQGISEHRRETLGKVAHWWFGETIVSVLMILLLHEPNHKNLYVHRGLKQIKLNCREMGKHYFSILFYFIFKSKWLHFFIWLLQTRLYASVHQQEKKKREKNNEKCLFG